MTASPDSLDDLAQSPQNKPAEPGIELVCGGCGHAFFAAMRELADAAAVLTCPACRKAFKMNQRFTHDALEQLDKRKRTAPIDQVLADLGKVLGS